MGQIWPEFLPLCCRPRNGRFYEKRGVSGPSVLLGPEMVKFCRNLCSCAVDLEMAVFNWKRAVSGSSALLGPEIVKFCRNLCSCAVDLEMAVFTRNGPFLAHLPFERRNGSNLARISAIVL